MSKKNADLILNCINAIKDTDEIFVNLEDMMSEESAKYYRKQWRLLRKILFEFLEVKNNE